MNRSLVGLVILVAGLGLYLAYDFRSEDQGKAEKEKTSQLFPFAADQVNELTLTNAGQTIKLSRSIDGWKLEEPFKDEADNNYVDDFVGRLVKEHWVETAKEGEEIDWAVYGLDRPAGTITLKSQAGIAKTLEISTKKNFEQNSIGRFPGEKKVLILQPSWSMDLTRTPLEFRDKRLFRGKIGAVEHLEVTSREDQFEMERKDGKWIFASHPDWVIDQNRVREILGQVNEGRAIDILLEKDPTQAEQMKLGLQKPLAILKFRMTDKNWSVKLSRSAEKDHAIFAQVSEPTFLLKMDPVYLDKFEHLKANDFRDKKNPFSFEKSEIAKIELRTPVKKSALAKDGETWKWEGGGSEVNAADVKRLLDQVQASTILEYAERPQVAKFKGQTRLIFLNSKGVILNQWDWDEATKDIRLMRSMTSKDVFAMSETLFQQWPLSAFVKTKAGP